MESNNGVTSDDLVIVFNLDTFFIGNVIAMRDFPFYIIMSKAIKILIF